MIRHQNTDDTILYSALMRGIPPPVDACHFENYQGGWMPLISVLALRQHFDDDTKIIGKSKKSDFCIVYILWSHWAVLLIHNWFGRKHNIVSHQGGNILYSSLSICLPLSNIVLMYYKCHIHFNTHCPIHENSSAEFTLYNNSFNILQQIFDMLM
jgi:hypothetical protein